MWTRLASSPAPVSTSAAAAIRCASVRATSPDGGKPVTLAALRQIALTPFVKHAFSHAFVTLAIKDHATRADFEPNEYVFWGLLNTRDRDRLKAAGPTDETLRWVALLYRVAVAVDEPPAKSIQGGFRVSLRTASNWVAAARRAGYLGPSDSTGKAAS